jgi:hypothetical protein
MDEQVQNDWVARVLSVQIGHAARADSASALPDWQKAVTDAQTRVGLLAAATRETRDKAFMQVAQRLGPMLDEFCIPVTSALTALEQAAPEDFAERRASALQVFGDVLSRLAADRRIAVVDDNPFDLPMNVGGLLGDAVRRLQAALNTGMAAAKSGFS